MYTPFVSNKSKLLPVGLMLAFMIGCLLIYLPGFSGGWLFDDYPNIVDNPGVQPRHSSLGALISAALSSPASDFKRPLASLSFAANYMLSGLSAPAMKLTNLVIHLLNGLLVFVLMRLLLAVPGRWQAPAGKPDRSWNIGMLAALIAGAWMLLPINLTAVLYVVQRMESLANLFVLAGLVGYIKARQLMWTGRRLAGGLMAALAVTVPAALGLLAKETAVMLPLYALLLEWILFDFASAAASPRRERGLIAFFVVILGIPLIAGLVWLLPGVLNPATWATRDFGLTQRLLSEARIIVGYAFWTLTPWPHALSFYHDDYPISSGLLHPWTTLTSLLTLLAVLWVILRYRRRQPLLALGLAWFLSAQLLTGTIIPLELVYEHRNYFASLGLLLAVIPWLAGLPLPAFTMARSHALPLRRTVLVLALVGWTSLTAITAWDWGSPLRLAETLAARAPDSPRAQYELGRTYIVYSHYDRTSPYTRAAYAPLEHAAILPDSSILPQQALIFMNSRMGLPLKPEWWDSMIAKLKARPLGVQDDSSLAALTDCARDEVCHLPKDRMSEAFEAALDHPHPTSRLTATYGDYAWNVLRNHTLGLSLLQRTVAADPHEPAYRITLTRMLIASGDAPAARQQLAVLQQLNLGGRLDGDISNLQQRIAAMPPPRPASAQS
ncbi:hypothetical protein ACYJW8_15360 [Frateuria aurantia]